MSGGARGRGRPRNADVDELVLEAARELEAALGYEGASIEAIASRAGVAKTSIYRRWPNKGILMYEAVMTPGVGADVPDTGDVTADLLSVMTSNAEGMRRSRHRRFLSSLFTAAVHEPELAARLRDDFLGPRADAIVRRVEIAVERGELAPTVDADLVPALLTGPLQYLLVVRESALAPDELRRVVEAVVGPHRVRGS